MFHRYTTDFDRTFAAMEQLRRRMDNLFDDAIARRGGDVEDRYGFPRGALRDTGSSLIVELELPGLADKDVQLTIHQDVLSLTGEKKSDAPDGYYVHRRERAPLKFGKSFALPCKVDPEKSSAVLKSGVLTVTLVKAAGAQPRQITVKAS
jgi:HSP20 family protein